MDNIEYLTRKNAIVLKYTCMVLVPIHQISNIRITKKMVTDMKLFVSKYKDEQNIKVGHAPLINLNCTYCSVYLTDDDTCGGCPMEEDDNCCLDGGYDTYTECTEEIEYLSLKDLTKLTNSLVSLAEEFVESNKHILGDDNE